MRKLTALFAFLVLTSSISFADSYSSGPSAFGIGGKFFCVPVLTPPALPMTIGNFFASNTMSVPIPGTPSVIWTLTGEPMAFYLIRLTDPINVLGLGAGIPQIHGSWKYTSAGGFFVNTPWWGTGFGGFVETPGAGLPWPTLGVHGPFGADLKCNKPSVFTFTAKTVDTGSMPGNHTFNISVSVNAMI